jgi:hypothetical protein
MPRRCLHDFVALRVQHLCSCVARGAVRLVACVDGPWGEPLGPPYGVGRRWTLGMALAAPLSGVKIVGTIVDL